MKITGKVIRGEHFGKTLGFPTANLDRRDFVRRKLKPKLGIYAGWATYNLQPTSYKLCKAAIVIGPVGKNGFPKIEAHLIGYKGNLYGKRLTLELKKYIRPFKKYKDVGELKKQIARDIVTIKKILK